jgi:hypothetical protein
VDEIADLLVRLMLSGVAKPKPGRRLPKKSKVD